AVYHTETHRRISLAAVDASVLNGAFVKTIGLKALDEDQRFPNSKRVSRTIRELLQDGSIFEDELPRVVNHFYDPVHNTQLTIPHPLDDRTQLGAIGYDDEVDSQAARGPRLGRAGDGHQRSSGANQARRPLPDVAADDIENQIDCADVFQGFVIEVDELLCAEVESRLTAASAPGADDVRAGLTCELA